VVSSNDPYLITSLIFMGAGVMLIVVSMHFIGRELLEFRDTNSDYQEMRYLIVMLSAFLLTAIAPPVIYRVMRLLGHDSEAWRNFATVTSGLSYLIIAVVLLLVTTFSKRRRK
jgi:MFS family permease